MKTTTGLSVVPEGYTTVTPRIVPIAISPASEI